MTSIDLDQLEQAHAKATEGEWDWEEGTGVYSHNNADGLGYTSVAESGHRVRDHDAVWIAAIHNAAPALIAELREARAAIERVRALAYGFAVGADGEERILEALDGA